MELKVCRPKQKWITIGGKYYLNELTDYKPLFYYWHQWEKDHFRNEHDNCETVNFVKLGLENPNAFYITDKDEAVQIIEDIQNHNNLKSNWAKLIYFVEHYVKSYFTAFDKSPRAYICTTNDKGIDPKVLAYETMWEMIKSHRIDNWIQLDFLLLDLQDHYRKDELDIYFERVFKRLGC
jgi:hypothetical protein